MNHHFEQRLARSWPTTNWEDVTTLLAVSGGPDSIALLRAVAALRGQTATGSLVVIHYNHRLRGAESEDDEVLVRETAQQLNCRCIVDRAAPTSAEEVSEDEARRARYEFFSRAAKTQGARYVVTAHTADDQAETILLRILRGTGLDGLSGIPFSRQLAHGVSLIRPLLDCSRGEILRYLVSIGQPFRHDSTNADSRFTRNRVRNELIPQLEQDYNPRIKEALLRLGRMAAESQSVVEKAVKDLHERSVRHTGPAGAVLDCDALAATNSYLVQQLLIAIWRDCGWRLGAMTWDHWRQLAGFVISDADTVRAAEFPGKVRVQREGNLLVLTAPASQTSE